MNYENILVLYNDLDKDKTNEIKHILMNYKINMYFRFVSQGHGPDMIDSIN